MLFVRFVALTFLTVLGDENVLLGNNGRFIVDVSRGPENSKVLFDAGVTDKFFGRSGAVNSFNGVLG